MPGAAVAMPNSKILSRLPTRRTLRRERPRAGAGQHEDRPGQLPYEAQWRALRGGAFARIVETGLFLKQKPRADSATQSGPMLVNTLVFAISETEVSFGEFARLFLDKLQCKNALFLDGGIAPSLYSPESGRKAIYCRLVL
jgi:hypothetical protein